MAIPVYQKMGGSTTHFLLFKTQTIHKAPKGSLSLWGPFVDASIFQNPAKDVTDSLLDHLGYIFRRDLLIGL